MSGYAKITIDGHQLVSWDNTYKKWYFRTSDENINIFKGGLGVNDESLFGYRAPVAIIRRRLQLDGYDLKSAEKDFNDTKAIWIKDIYETLAVNRVEVELRGHFLMPDDLYHIEEDLKILKNTNFETWVKKIPVLIKFMSDNKDYKLSERDKCDPLLFFMLSYPIAIHVDNTGFVGALFPCMQMESYAAVLLSISKDDGVCELDASGLLSGGWSEFIDEQNYTQESETKFYNEFLDSLDELSKLNQEKKNSLPQWKHTYQKQ